jgi:hypothetical protein
MYAGPRCSKCSATDTRLSHRRRWEKPFSWLIVPFRCRVCRERFWKIRFALHLKKVQRPVVSKRKGPPGWLVQTKRLLKWLHDLHDFG